MAQKTPRLGELRPGMEHLEFKVNIANIKGVRKVKTYSGIEHSILEGELSDNISTISFAAWNEKIDLFIGIVMGDTVSLSDCFVTSYKGVLQLNIGRDSIVQKIEGEL
jgi:ssDNA-binding replication factor A large subunit